jgi:hypothetical protein
MRVDDSRARSQAAPGRRRVGVSSAWVAAAVVVGAVALNLIAYRLGKDCGAWEARQRLRGADRPLLCFERP